MGKSHRQLSKTMCWKHQPWLQQSPTGPKATHYPADDPMEWTNHLVQAPHLLTLESEDREDGKIWGVVPGTLEGHSFLKPSSQVLLRGRMTSGQSLAGHHSSPGSPNWETLDSPLVSPRAPPQAYKGHRARQLSSLAWRRRRVTATWSAPAPGSAQLHPAQQQAPGSRPPARPHSANCPEGGGWRRSLPLESRRCSAWVSPRSLKEKGTAPSICHRTSTELFTRFKCTLC